MNRRPSSPPSDDGLTAARAAKKKLAKSLPNAALGITRCGEAYAIKVNLTEELPEGKSLPENVDGVPVKTEVVGPIKKR